MKTLTEFSGNLIRQAAKLRKDLRAAAHAAEPPPPAPAPAVAPVADAPAPPAEAEAPASDAATAAADAAAAAPAEAEALGAAVGIQGDRLARLIEALDAVGDAVHTVNRVRVFGGDDQPPGARKRGDFQYVVDLIPRPQGDGRRERGRPGGRGGRERGEGGGHGRPGRPGRESGGMEREPPRGEVPSGGAGWTLSRAPGDPNDRRGDRRGRPGGRGRPPRGGKGPGRGGHGGPGGAGPGGGGG